MTLDHRYAGGGCKWVESNARRWDELGLWNLEGVDQPLITKTAIVSIPSKMKNEQFKEGEVKDPDCEANTIKRALYLQGNE